MNSMFLRATRLMAPLRWLRFKELKFFIMVPVWLYGYQNLWRECFQPLHDRILKIWKATGGSNTAKYLAEIQRVLLLWISGEKYYQTSVWVQIARSGLPTFLPAALRQRLFYCRGGVGWSAQLLFRVVITILGCYRVMGAPPQFKLETITGPFTGIGRTLPLEEILRVLTWFPVKVLQLGGAAWLLEESAGPNYPKATWGSPLDAIAFLFQPRVWWSWLTIAVQSRAFWLLAWQLGIIILTLPVLPLVVVMASSLLLGKLVPLFEARGKVRIIAVTDWWTQCLLFPLSQAISSVLKLIPQDGTYHQTEPLTRLMDYVRESKSGCWSFDLSAATDRLPIDLQVQILKAMGIAWASSWANLLSGRHWDYKGTKTRYAVGQPMGARSSWAMLALTHHFVVQISALRAGWSSWFPHYALLGDDIVIANAAVAENYLAIMRHLGVTINMAKSFVTLSGLSEFAKRWVHPDLGELSPIGAGVLLVAIRNLRLLPMVLMDTLNKGFPISASLLTGIQRLLTFRSKKYRSSWEFAIGLLALGPSSGFWTTGQWSAIADGWIKQLLRGLDLVNLRTVVNLIKDQAITEVEGLEPGGTTLEREMSSSFWKYSLLGTSLAAGVLSLPLILIGPGFWRYVWKIATWDEYYGDMVQKLNQSLYDLNRGAPLLETESQDELILRLSGFDPTESGSQSLFDWRSRQRSLDVLASVKTLRKELERVSARRVRAQQRQAMSEGMGWTTLEANPKWALPQSPRSE